MNRGIFPVGEGRKFSLWEKGGNFPVGEGGGNFPVGKGENLYAV